MLEYPFVRATKDKVIYPPNIPRERSAKPLKYTFLLSSLLLTCSFFMIGSDVSFSLILFGVASNNIVVLFILEVVRRCMDLIEEKDHLVSRYGNNRMDLFQQIFHFEKFAFVSFFLATIVSVVCYFNEFNYDFARNSNRNLAGTFLICIVVYLLHPVFQFSESPVYFSKRIKHMKVLDYGSGMAYSFFYGYLKIVLPKDGQNLGLEGLMKKYESTERIKFDSYKLHILLPLSLNCPPSLENEFSKSVLTAKTLESTIRDVAGVKNRDYKNSVYKIGMTPCVYVCAEYATPLKTLDSVMRSGNKDCGLKKNECRCEDKNKNGDYIDVGIIIKLFLDYKKSMRLTNL